MFPAVPLLSPSLVSARHHVVTLSLPRLSRGNHIIVMAVRLFPISPDRRHQRRNHWPTPSMRVPHLRAAAYLRLLPVAPVHRKRAVTYAGVHHPQMSTATSIAGMAQQLSRGFGVLFVAVLLQLSLAWVARARSAPPTSRLLSPALRRSRSCPSALAGPCATMRRPTSAATGQNRRRYRP
jgi:hypothetical protein